MAWAIDVKGVHKSFVLHLQGGVRIPVLQGFDLAVASGESVALTGPSGAGKSTVLRLLYGNYAAERGRLGVLHGTAMVDVAAAAPLQILELRRWTLGYVSQFLRVIPRVPAWDVVAEPLLRRGMAEAEARRRAAAVLERLNIPRRLWPLAPMTFSGGEQQRINIARVFACDYPLLLLDEPTASLDPANRNTVVAMITEARSRGAAVVGIYHDDRVREAVADRTIFLEKTS